MHSPPETSPDRLVYSVSALVQEARECLELTFPALWVEGEISNFSRPASGHWYFTLKDESAQLRCAMFRNRNRQAGLVPEQGMQVLIRGRIGLYVPRGEFQMVVEQLEEAGAGALQRAFEALKSQLQGEGLFAATHKQALPGTPQRIGVITSATGAAIRDILSVLRRRYPVAEVVLYPVPVQGEEAAPAIVTALQTAGRRQDCEVLILARGGGSLEDLWAFNEESVARAVYACPIPVVSGIGHETDFTITDFVADQRAATPSAAAELVSPDCQDWQHSLNLRINQLTRLQQSLLQQASQRRQWLLHRLLQQHPSRRLDMHLQRLDELEQRLGRSQAAVQNSRRQRLDALTARLGSKHPQGSIDQHRQLARLHQQRLLAAMQQHLGQVRQQVAVGMRALDSLSPLKTLERGYAVATTAEGQLLTRAAQTTAGETLQLQLHRGRLDCTVRQVHEDIDETQGR